MKFAIAAVVLLAVAMGVQSSIVGLNGLGLGVSNLGLVNGAGYGINSYGVNGLGLGLGLGGASLAYAQPLIQQSSYISAPAAVNYAAQIPAAVNVVNSPAYAPAAVNYAAQIPAAVNVVASPAYAQVAVAPQAAIVAPIAAHGASYVAKTRGSIHTAPLAGHIKSAASINVAPAPGTW